MNQRELDVLNILHAAKEPMTSTEIVNSKNGLTQSTVIAVLRILLRDGLVEITGVTYSGKVLSRTYKSTVAAKEAILDHFVQQYNSFRDVVSPEELLEFINRSKSLN